MTKRGNDSKPTQAELAILQVLWAQGPSTVRSVHEALSAERETGYTTTLKLMQLMHGKGLLTRSEDDRAHIYSVTQTANKSRTGLVKRLIDQAFAGSSKDLVMHALRSTKTTPAELAEIRAELERITKDNLK